jgi:hypothetical protein
MSHIGIMGTRATLPSFLSLVVDHPSVTLNICFCWANIEIVDVESFRFTITIVPLRYLKCMYQTLWGRLAA